MKTSFCALTIALLNDNVSLEMITHLWYTNGVIHHAPVCARATLLPPCGANSELPASRFSPPSLRFASLCLDSIHGRSSRINRFTVRILFLLDVVFANVCERGNRHEDTLGMNEKSHVSFNTFICTVLVDKTGCRKLRFQPQNEKRVC